MWWSCSAHEVCSKAAVHILPALKLLVAVCRCIGQEVAALPANAIVGFMKVSAKPLKASLATWASKWVYLFTHYLQNKVVNSISELYSFMDSADATLALKVLGEVDENGEPVTELAEGRAVLSCVSVGKALQRAPLCSCWCLLFIILLKRVGLQHDATVLVCTA